MNLMDVSEITNPSGTGIYDVLLNTTMTHLRGEYAAQRITADTYAQVYVQMINQVLQVSTQFALGVHQSNTNTELMNQKLITEKAQTQDKIEELKGVTDEDGTVQGAVGKQKAVYDTQIQAFRDRALQDFSNSILNTWSVRRTSDPDTMATKENLLTDLDIGKAIKHVADHLGVPLPNPEPAPPTPDP